jgi:Ca2+-binding EF-hand superfamily protein
MSMGGIGACGSHDLSKVLGALLARLDDSTDEVATPATETATAAKAEDCGKRWHRGEARLSSDILHVLLRLQQQEERAAADETSDAESAGESTSPADATTADAAEKDRGTPTRRLFQAMDADRDGNVTKEELAAFIQAKGGTQEEADKLYALLDKDGDGKLGEDQLAEAAKRGRHHHYGFAKFAERLFAKIDADGDGSMTKEELERFATEKGGTAERADRFFSRADMNEDGTVDQNEFTQAIRPNLHRPHFHRGGGNKDEGGNA